jgi:hypothetical protein
MTWKELVYDPDSKKGIKIEEMSSGRFLRIRDELESSADEEE